MNLFDEPYTMAILALSAAILLYILVQFFHRIVLDPYLDYRKLKGQITARLAYYDTFVSYPPRADAPSHSYEHKSEQLSELQWDLRRLSGELAGAYEMLHLRWLFILLGGIPRRANLHKACALLLTISDNLWSDDPRSEIRLESNWFRRKRVSRLLRIRWHGQKVQVHSKK